MQVLAPDVAAAVVPRHAASVLVLRDGPSGLEVLMVRRSPHASFMPGAYVFPGGAVDAGDGEAGDDAIDEGANALGKRIGTVTGIDSAAAAALAVAALRECFEECGLWPGAPAEAATALPALRARLHAGAGLAELARTAGFRLATSALQPWAHWLTPLGLPKRFDTLFFACRAPADQQASVDAGETTTLAWVAPAQALAEHKSGHFAMEFATVRLVESLLPFATSGVAALLDAAASRRDPLPLVSPRLQLDAERRIRGILLPGQPGFDALPAG